MTVDVAHETIIEVLNRGKFLLLHRDSAFTLLSANRLKLLASQMVLFTEQPQHDLLCLGLCNILPLRGCGRPPACRVFPGLVLMLKF